MTAPGRCFLQRLELHRLGLMLALVWSPLLIAQPSLYHVNSADSFVHIYTDVEGILRAFSHRHLIAITDIKGELVLSEEGNSARLRFWPESFLVDDKAERARAADPEFREPVEEGIQAGTRENMLGPRLLDVENYPQITVDIRLDRISSAPLFDVKIYLKGTEKHLQIPAILEVDDRHVWATGYFELTHADLGLEPFTALGGLMRVAESLRVQFEIFAEPASTGVDQATD